MGTQKIKRVAREIAMYVEVYRAIEDHMHVACYAASSLAWRAAFGVAELLAIDRQRIALQNKCLPLGRNSGKKTFF
jgi:hypothetical protein